MNLDHINIWKFLQQKNAEAHNITTVVLSDRLELYHCNFLQCGSFGGKDLFCALKNKDLLTILFNF